MIDRQAVYPVNKSLFNILKHFPVILWSLIVLLPLIMLFFVSFKTNAEYSHTLPIMPPHSFLNFANYERTLIEGRILSSLLNSFILVVFGSALNVLFCSMTAYCMDRFDFFLKKTINGLYVASAIVPTALLQVMIYQIMKFFGLTGTFGAPILIYAATGIIQVWIYLQFFEKIPVSLDESAMIDGASYLRIFTAIVFPLLKPATATVIITQSIMIYNDMFTQYLYCSSSNMQTATTALMAFSGQFATTFNVMASGCVAVMIPTLIIFLILQKQVFSGLTVGAVKN